VASLHLTDGRIEAVSRLTAGGRVALFLVGLVPLLAPYELLLRPRWTTFASPVFAFFLIISLGATAVSMLLMSGAFLGRSTQLVIERASRTVRRTTRGLLRATTRSAPLEQVVSATVTRHEDSDGPDTSSLCLTLTDGSRLESPRLPDAAAATQAAQLVSTWRDLGPARSRPLSETPASRSPG
jgi:hypothetical protein